MSDYIKREDAIKVVGDYLELLEVNRRYAKSVLNKLPSANVIEPKRGEWKRRIVDNGFNADWVCSECGYRVKTDFVDYNFCPNCGCAMTKAGE